MVRMTGSNYIPVESSFINDSLKTPSSDELLCWYKQREGYEEAIFLREQYYYTSGFF